jgi:hypothetical protein
VKSGLLRWWPALPAALIIYLGADSFVSQYPTFSDRRAARASASAAPDSLLAMARRAADEDSARETRPASMKDNPFRTSTPRSGGKHHGKPPPPPPPRNYMLKGTVGNNVATITNSTGQKLILKIGDWVDSAQVVSIEANKVVLKDRGGTFELMMEK